ncbi:MAG: hypothetical protein A2W29_01125 [Gemmatimonadetes bacterium RBG_16_66_8]|nr:MAG: hypothetical protein A2W29_01125 [Gemmatimonadetes bacterium RBG_16_66_8]
MRESVVPIRKNAASVPLVVSHDDGEQDRRGENGARHQRRFDEEQERHREHTEAKADGAVQDRPGQGDEGYQEQLGGDSWGGGRSMATAARLSGAKGQGRH